MTLRKVAFATAFLAVGLTSAMAQDTTVIRENTGPSVTVTAPSVSVGSGSRDVTVERRRETTGESDCRSRSVTREDSSGSTTVTRERCD